MTDMIMVFTCFNQNLPPTALRQFTVVARALLSMTGRMTLLGLLAGLAKAGVIARSNVFSRPR